MKLSKYQGEILERLRNGESLAASLTGSGMDNYRWRDSEGKCTNEKCVNLDSILILRRDGFIHNEDVVVKTIPNNGNPIVIKQRVVSLVEK